VWQYHIKRWSFLGEKWCGQTTKKAVKNAGKEADEDLTTGLALFN